MDLSSELRREIETALGTNRHIHSVRAVHGGCITPVARIDFDDGTKAFLKWSESGDTPAGFFHEEARSLRALAASKTVRAPEVLAHGDTWLLLEWLEPGRANASTWTNLGRDLARMHRTQNNDFGWHRDNWIGSLPQANACHTAWPDFWRHQRITPQWRRARAGGFFEDGDEHSIERLFARLNDLLAPGNTDGPSLLHGDLWSGNAHVLASGDAALIDPSAYFGHREVDLAMASLFGGFGPDFFREYLRTWPLAAGSERRRHVYQLYYLLVHVNLFGTSYVNGARAALHSALRD